MRDEADKVRYGRHVPLSAQARTALDEVCPEVGLLFPERDLSSTLRAAARRAGLDEEKVERLSNYDFRHARLTYLASRTTNLTGLAFLAGHRQVTTTAKYVHGRFDAAEDVLAAAAGDGEPRAVAGDGNGPDAAE